jgi:hypothetical protein
MSAPMADGVIYDGVTKAGDAAYCRKADMASKGAFFAV